MDMHIYFFQVCCSAALAERISFLLLCVHNNSPAFLLRFLGKSHLSVTLLFKCRIFAYQTKNVQGIFKALYERFPLTMPTRYQVRWENYVSKLT